MSTIKRFRPPHPPNFQRLTRDPSGLRYLGCKGTGYRVSLSDDTLIGQVTLTSQRVRHSANFLWLATRPDGLPMLTLFLSRSDAGAALENARNGVPVTTGIPMEARAA